MGRALEYLLQQENHTIRLFDIEPGKVAAGFSLEEVVKNADGIFFCVPSWVMRSALQDMRPWLGSDAVVVSLAKGLERETHLTMGELLAEVLPAGHSFALLAGPTMAEEILQGQGSAAVVATAKRETYDRVASFFHGTSLRLEWSDDLRSVAFASVLKNVYALGLGIFSALDRGGNDLGYFFSRMMQEMLAVGHALGVSEKVLMGVAGLGDLVCTGFSPHSRNRQVGEAMVRKGACPSGSEGCVALPSLFFLLGERRSLAPIAQAIERVVEKQEDAQPAFSKI